MTALRLDGRRRAWRGVALLAIVGVLAGCTASKSAKPQAQMPELPLRTLDQFFEIRWALQREPAVVRAIGQISYAVDDEYRITLAFYGLDAAGRIMSRSSTYVRSTFGFEPIPFAVELVPTGRETSFEVQILNYRSATPRMR